MQELNYRGFHGTPSCCGFGYTECAGVKVFVFEHLMIGTSPQNMIEELTSWAFNEYFPGKSPDQLRVFEIDRSGQGLFTHQEVSFGTVTSADGSCSFGQPGWSPLSNQDKAWLDGMLASGQL